MLKSPLFGLDDDEPVQAGLGCGRASLRQALDARADDNPRWQRARQRLEACAARARQRGAVLVLRLAARRLMAAVAGMLRRLGPEADRRARRVSGAWR
ncbi:MAG: hypothetical protein MZV49_20950 [Rhodopseudomonas palustris]|nr:hypothetical protein [Rhodopseudomonas palustris]